MINDLPTKMNNLVDQLAKGKLSMRSFLRQIKKFGVMEASIGELVRKPPPGPPLTDRLVRSGLVVQIRSIEDTGETLVDGVVKPDAIELTQIVRSGPWTLETVNGPVTVAMGARTKQAVVGKPLRIAAGRGVRFVAPSRRPVRFVARQPIWEPDAYGYVYDRKRIDGGEMWFEMKIALEDDVERPMYNVLSSGEKGNYVLVTIEPGTKTIRSYYTDGDYVVTGVLGRGSVTIRKPRGKDRIFEVERGDAVDIKAKERFQISNSTDDTLLVEIRSKALRYWNPDSSYYEITPGKFAAGNKIFFEYVIPT